MYQGSICKVNVRGNHSFRKCLVETYQAPGTGLDVGDKALNNTSCSLVFVELIFWMREAENKH